MNLYDLNLLHHTTGQVHVYLIASFVKIITKHNVYRHMLIQVSQDGFMLRLTYMHVLGL